MHSVLGKTGEDTSLENTLKILHELTAALHDNLTCCINSKGDFSPSKFNLQDYLKNYITISQVTFPLISNSINIEPIPPAQPIPPLKSDEPHKPIPHKTEQHKQGTKHE